jgi:hypothetical protein
MLRAWLVTVPVLALRVQVVNCALQLQQQKRAGYFHTFRTTQLMR